MVLETRRTLSVQSSTYYSTLAFVSKEVLQPLLRSNHALKKSFERKILNY